MINHVGVKMKQPPATTTATLKGGRDAVSTDLYIETVLVCLFFFRLALKINARGVRKTEKLIIVPLDEHRMQFEDIDVSLSDDRRPADRCIAVRTCHCQRRA